MGRHCHAHQSVPERRMNAVGALHTDERRYLEWRRMRISGSFLTAASTEQVKLVALTTAALVFLHG